MTRATLDSIRDSLLTADPEPSAPAAWLFLLRDFIATGYPPTGDVVERGLTAALHLASADADPCRRVQWVRLIAEAVLISDDARLVQVVEASLPASVDLLDERVRGWYEPGKGLVGQSLEVHLAYANALLDAFDMTGRLPYSRLADELVQLARRNPAVQPGAPEFADLAAADLLRALTRLTKLHADPEYRAAAALPPGGIDTAEAARLAEAFDGWRGDTRVAAHVGLALLGRFALGPDLQ